MNSARLVKGALVTAAATAVCHSLMYAGYGWARDAKADSPNTILAGGFEFALVTAVSWILMPLLLWAGLRLTREKGAALLVLGGGFGWVLISGYFIDDIDRAGGHMPIPALLAYVLLGTALAGAGAGPGRD
ncbi:hypothetical protein [Streptomyces katsurahamanus]|uniref:Uncharacterized protein n=1 Tax=Streptomyces katsurahamanus TaxID=2577098 RepID=A0ABW9NYE6_9ACTN|nr:hypothetical protein [Streptomyces katsurahamanus]MQS37869.1 hypothetical protein [Streptomyces katsurahamanus]